MRIAHFANTVVGKAGNIGVRTEQVLRRLLAREFCASCVCRGTVASVSGTDFVSMGWLGHLPRAMNAARTYVWPTFNHRPLDIALFERFAIYQLARLLRADEMQVAHVWDTCPRLIRQLKSHGMRVLLDVPIAPITYGKRMKQDGRAMFLLDDQKLIDIELQAFGEADLLIAPSVFVLDELVRAGVRREKICMVEFGANVDDSERARPRASVHDKNGSLDFCFLGIVNRRKGIPQLLQAWSHEAFRYDRLHLCGRVFPEVMEDLGRAKGGRLVLPGFVRPEDYLAQCDVFVFPSWLEGSAKAVFDAMACGLPVIVTTSTGSVVRDGIDGFVIEPGDAAALRQRMLWFKENPEAIVTMGAHARRRAREFTWDRYAHRVIDLYSGSQL